MCYSAGLKPGEFWDCTIDEAILCYKGKVDEWRFIRNNTYLIHCSLVRDRVNITEALPLPFDDEGAPNHDDIIADYWKLVNSGALN